MAKNTNWILIENKKWCQASRPEEMSKIECKFAFFLDNSNY